MLQDLRWSKALQRSAWLASDFWAAGTACGSFSWFERVPSPTNIHHLVTFVFAHCNMRSCHAGMTCQMMRNMSWRKTTIHTLQRKDENSLTSHNLCDVTTKFRNFVQKILVWAVAKSAASNSDWKESTGCNKFPICTRSTCFATCDCTLEYWMRMPADALFCIFLYPPSKRQCKMWSSPVAKLSMKFDKFPTSHRV